MTFRSQIYTIIIWIVKPVSSGEVDAESEDEDDEDDDCKKSMDEVLTAACVYRAY